MSRYGVRRGLITVDGDLVDIPAPTRCFQRLGHEARAARHASHRMGHRQKEAVGHYYWTHPYVPDVAFGSRQQAIKAALRSVTTPTDSNGDNPR